MEITRTETGSKSTVTTEHTVMELPEGTKLEVWRFTWYFSTGTTICLQTARNGKITHYWSNDPERQKRARGFILPRMGERQ